MTESQRAIFHEGTRFHWLIEVDTPLDATAADIGAWAARVRGAADAGPPAEAVNVVIAFGDSLLQRLWPQRRPPGLRPFSAVADAPARQADALVWIHSDRYDRNFEVARAAAGGFTIVNDTPGFVYRDSRDLTGFIDGTENPPADDAAELAVNGSGGSFVFAQRWVHDLARFHALEQVEQEAVIGRTRADSVELENKLPTAHIARVVIEDSSGDELEIYRRSFPYGTAREAGLQFLAFTDDLVTIDRMLANMFGTSGDGLRDRLTEFTRPVTGGYYFAPSKTDLEAMIG